MQINVTLDVKEDNKKGILIVLEGLQAIGAISQYQLKEVKEQIENYDK